MSKISEISRQYHTALSASKEQYEEMYRERAEATEDFYRSFFHDLVCDFGHRFLNERFRARLQERIERVLGTNRLEFIAIDGTCNREIFSDFVTFFGGAYGARGEIDFTGGQHQIRYKRWSLDQDVSMVAWIPVPFARLAEVSSERGEEFLMTEEERINLSSVHVQVMQLAEIFLAYNTIVSSRLDSPQILLMDLSPSSVLASVAHSQEGLGLIGYPYDRRELTRGDVTVALAHPFSEFLSIPSPKKMDLHRVVVAALHRAPKQPVDLQDLAARYGVTPEELRREAVKPNGLVERGILQPTSAAQVFRPALNAEQSWAFTRELFQNICSRLFMKKDASALQYDLTDERGVVRRHWMAPDDLSFLIGVGMRLLVEACWEKNVLLYGVVKDSSSRYLTRNFLGVALETGFYPQLRELRIELLPWTDRIFCETLPLVDDNLTAPWCTIEFDSAFMTLHRGRVENSEKTQVAGIQGRIVNQERLFARSLAQFFLKRDKRTPLMGHVVFLDRLLSPAWDRLEHVERPAEILVDTAELGHFPVYAWRDREHVNPGQWIMMYLLSVLTRNHFAEAIGYPDPLHKADWGAKTIGRSVRDTIRSSTRLMAAKPLSRTFRDIRDRGRR